MCTVVLDTLFFVLKFSYINYAVCFFPNFLPGPVVEPRGKVFTCIWQQQQQQQQQQQHQQQQNENENENENQSVKLNWYIRI